jgi:PAS domain S-box-containing protein
LGAAILILLLLGLLFATWNLGRENRRIREDLLFQAQLLAETIPLDRVKVLDGTAADENKPEYRRLKEQFVALEQINPAWSSVYLMGRTDGTVFFLLDSESVGAPNYCFPGMRFEEAPPRLHGVFNAHRATTDGPISDRWGIWVSAFVPLLDLKTGDLVAVLGVDIEAAAWRKLMLRAAGVPLLFTLALLSVLLAAFRLRKWRTSASLALQRRWRPVEAVLTAALGLILTLTAVWLANSVEVRNRKTAFSALAQIKTERILEAFLSLRNAEVQGIAHFIEGSESVTREEFRRYAKYLLRVPEVMAWGWVPAVRANEKDAFEQATRETGFKSYQIWEIDAAGKRIQASGRDVYYPLHYVESTVSLAKYGITSGRNLGATAAIQAALDVAAQTGLITATDVMPALPGASTSRRQFLIFRPVGQLSGAAPLKGFAMALADPNIFLKAFASESVEGNRQVALELFQLRAGQPPDRLAAIPPLEDESDPVGALTGPWIAARPILAFGKTYAATARPTAEFMARHSFHIGWLVLLAGLSLTAAITLAVMFIVHRHEDLERLVGERTYDLAASMRRYDLLARHSRTITWELDADGVYVEVSDVVRDVLGYDPAELIGHLHFYDLHPEPGRAEHRDQAFDAASRKEPILDLVNPMTAKSGQIVWVSTNAVPILDLNGRLRGYQGTDTDITRRKLDAEELALLAKENQAAANRYAALIGASNTGAWEYHHDTGYMWTSPEYFAMLGRDPADFDLGPGTRNVEKIWLDLIHPDDRESARQDFVEYMQKPAGMYEHTFRMSHADGHWAWILSRGQLLRDAEERFLPVLVGTHIDITESKRAEQYREMVVETLQILSGPGEFNRLLEPLAATFKSKSGLDAVGIRLRQGDNYPFSVQQGFSIRCMAECGDVLVRDPAGQSLKDSAGSVILRCACGLALSDHAGHDHHWFSAGGSCWTNDLDQMLRSVPDLRQQPRDHCIQDGFASIALVPIRIQNQIVGLIQFHDRRKNQFTLETIQLLESIATHVGEAMLRKRAEDDYRTLFQTMQEGFALHELILDEGGRPVDYRFLALNPEFERMTGLNVARLVGKTVREALPGTDPRWIDIFGQVALTGQSIFFENYSKAQGKQFEVKVFRPAPKQFACIFSDITERTQAAHELRESRRRYVALLANLPGMAYRRQNDPELTLEFVSDGCRELTGYAPQDLIGNRARSYLDLVCEPQREGLRADWRQSLRTGHTFEREYEIATLTGETKWVWERGGGIANSQGQMVGIEGFIADVTGRKRAEAERERLNQAIEQSSEMIFITDAAGAILYVNPAFTKITGYSREEVLGKNPDLLKSGQHDQDFYRQMWQTVRAGGTWEGQIVNRRKDGTLYTEQSTISPVRDAAGNIVNYVSVNRDITQQFRDQMEREDLLDQLVQAQKMESIGRLAGGVAHDFNNMLQAILGYTEIALEQVQAGQPLHADLVEIQKAAQRSAALTRQLQTFARRQAVEPKVLNLNLAVEGMSAMLRRLIGEDVSLVWKPGPDLGSVKIDPSQLDQIVANLCVNARDAIEKSGHIIVETQNAEIDHFSQDLHGGIEPGAYVLLAISDDGCGITREVMHHIFEPFYTTKRPGKGTGLGLSTVYGIVKQNGGGIQVYSEPGKGSTFKIYLPRCTGTAETEPPAEPSGPPVQHHETILLVEDEESILQTTSRMLESLGYHVLATKSPEEALRLADGHGGENVLFQEFKDRIDLLITDVIMPEMNGPELARNLLGRHPGLKHLYMSGYTANLIAMKGIKEDGVHFIQKPFSRTLLAQKVREALRGK